MSFAPVLPTNGLAGWRFLQRTYDTQLAQQARSPVMQRELAYFRENISGIATAEDLVEDRTLLKVALGAFGLQEDLPNRAFIRRILETPPNDPKGLANRLADPRYRQFSKAFGFSASGGPNTRHFGFSANILEKYTRQSFETAIGATDENMRLALAAQRELSEIAAAPGSDTAKWFRVLGHPPLRKFFETAFGLPESFGQIDIDQQRTYLKGKSRSEFGAESFSDLTDPTRLDALIERFHLRSQMDLGAHLGRNDIALLLLGGA